jgi:hypothetical protein
MQYYYGDAIASGGGRMSVYARVMPPSDDASSTRRPLDCVRACVQSLSSSARIFIIDVPTPADLRVDPEHYDFVVKQLSHKKASSATELQTLLHLASAGNHRNISMMAFLIVTPARILVGWRHEGVSINVLNGSDIATLEWHDWQLWLQRSDVFTELVDTIDEVVAYLLTNGVIQRDWKLRNIMWNRGEQRFVVIDFGNVTALYAGALHESPIGLFADGRMVDFTYMTPLCVLQYAALCQLKTSLPPPVQARMQQIINVREPIALAALSE